MFQNIFQNVPVFTDDDLGKDNTNTNLISQSIDQLKNIQSNTIDTQKNLQSTGQNRNSHDDYDFDDNNQ